MISAVHTRSDEVVVIDAGYFGKFTLVHDTEAGYDTLYPKKLIFEPTSAMVPGTQIKVWPSDIKSTVKPLDMGRLTRLCKD